MSPSARRKRRRKHLGLLTWRVSRRWAVIDWHVPVGHDPAWTVWGPDDRKRIDPARPGQPTRRTREGERQAGAAVVRY